MNDLFEGDLTDQDKLVYVNNVFKGKLLEIGNAKQQAANNTKEQFANSPDLNQELMNAIIDALEAHTGDEHAGAGFGGGAQRAEGRAARAGATCMRRCGSSRPQGNNQATDGTP